MNGIFLDGVVEEENICFRPKRTLVVICLDIHTVYISAQTVWTALRCLWIPDLVCPKNSALLYSGQYLPGILDHAGSGSSELWGWSVLIRAVEWRGGGGRMQNLRMKRLKWVLGRCVWDSLRGSSWLRRKLERRCCFPIDTMEGRGQLSDGDDSRTLSLHLKEFMIFMGLAGSVVK